MQVHFVVPHDIDDPENPSGGNLYDRKISDGLSGLGWSVHEHAVPGSWPYPSPTDRAWLADTLSGIADSAVVLMDGLIASCVPEILHAHATRVRLVVLVHMLLAEPCATGARSGDASQADSVEVKNKEQRAFSYAQAIVTTSSWSRQRILDLYRLPTDRVVAAPPGTDLAPIVVHTHSASRLLCVSTVTPHKGHDLLVQALGMLTDREWTCVCVGSIRREPDFVAHLRHQAQELGIADRIQFVGPRTGPALHDHYANADLMVLASRGETFGMVIIEALMRGMPVVAADTQGIPEALGHDRDGHRPGILVPPNDAAALANALRQWLDSPELRHQLRQSSRDRRHSISGWDTTVARIAHVLSSMGVAQ